VGVRWFPLAEASSDSPYFRLGVFVSFDELRRERQTLADRDLKEGNVVVVVDEPGRDASFIEVEVLVFASFHSGLQTVLGMVNASAHSCAVSLPGEFSNFDGGDKAGDDFLETLGGDLVMGGQGGENGIWGHGSVVVEDACGGVGVVDNLDGIGTRGRDGIVDAVIGHVGTKVLDEVVEVIGEPGIWSEDESGSGLEETFQGEVVLAFVL